MPFDDPGRFQSQIAASEDHDDLFRELYVDFDPNSQSIAGLRRRRRRASNTPDDPIKTVSLVEEDGVLYWRDGIPAPEQPLRRRRRAARAGEPSPPDSSLVLTKQFP